MSGIRSKTAKLLVGVSIHRSANNTNHNLIKAMKYKD